MNVNDRPWGNLLTYTLRQCRRAFVTVGIFSLFINLLMLTVPLYMLQVFDRVLSSNRIETLILLTLMTLFALLIYGALECIRSWSLIRMSAWIDHKLNVPALMPCSDQVMRGNHYGVQSLKDIATLRQFLGGNGIQAFFDAPWIPVFIAVLYFLHPLLGWIGMMGGVVLFVLAIINERLTRQPIMDANQMAIKNAGFIDVMTRHADAIQAMGMVPHIIKRWLSSHQQVLALQSQASVGGSILYAASRCFRLMLQVMILGAGAYLVVQGEITPGVMIAGSIILARAMAPIEQSISSWKAMIAAQQGYQRLRTYFFQTGLPETRTALPEPKGLLHAENVSYIPVGMTEPVIKKINLEVQPGQVLGIIGPTAAGKSTLLRLLVGSLEPSVGCVRLDHGNMRDWDRETVGQHIGYLPQTVSLFPGTIAENIARLRDVDDKQVIAAAQLAHVHELILRLPQGYDTIIDDQHHVLSGGQQQRIALARAVYGNPCLIVLDEPNANLDHDGDQAILQTLQQLKAAHRTVIIVSHRPNLVAQVDQVVVLMDGVIQSQGPRDVVLQRLQHNTAQPPARTGHY